MSMCILVIPFLFGQVDVKVMVPECPKVLPNSYRVHSFNQARTDMTIRGYLEYERTTGHGAVVKEKVLVYEGKGYPVKET